MAFAHRARQAVPLVQGEHMLLIVKRFGRAQTRTSMKTPAMVPSLSGSALRTLWPPQMLISVH